MGTNFNDINLICFPYAGGSKYSYASFQSFAPKGVNIIPIELPGRGARLSEPLLFDLDSMVDDLFVQFKRHLYKPYILYGHSMGAILSYLVLKKIAANNLPLPLHLIVTGSGGPSVKEARKKNRASLPTDEFIEELKTLGGISDDVLEDPSFLDFFAPILRADFKAMEDYEYIKESPLDIPICVLFGAEEECSISEALAWQEESSFEIEIIQFPGDHFFIFRHGKRIMDIIKQKSTGE